jgi:hypothetical protein
LAWRKQNYSTDPATPTLEYLSVKTPIASSCRFLSPRGWLVLVLFLPAGRAAESLTPSSEMTAVSSKVFNGYVRTKLANGSYRPERYGFAIGGMLSGSEAGGGSSSTLPTNDPTVDKATFTAIGRVIEGPLAAQNYLPTDEPKSADLLILVFWGRTIGTNAFGGSELSQTLDGGEKDKIDSQNAKLLGFDSERVFDQGFDDPSNMMSNIRRQVHSGTMDAIEADRYFVILQAFDFQPLWRQKKVRLLWETRFSLDQRSHDFGKDLPRMAQIASQYFGQDSRGLVTKPVPEGHVDIGDVKSLGPLPEK